MTDCISRYLRRKGEFLVSEGDDREAGTSKNPIHYIQVSNYYYSSSDMLNCNCRFNFFLDLKYHYLVLFLLYTIFKK